MPPALLDVGLGIRTAINITIAWMLFRHVHRHRGALAVMAGNRFPSLYWWFGAIFLLRAIETAWLFAFADAPIPLRMASDLVAVVTIDRLWRSQEQSIRQWAREEHGELQQMVRNVTDAAQAVVRRYGDGGADRDR